MSSSHSPRAMAPDDAAAATRALAARAARLDPRVATTVTCWRIREHKVFVDSTRSGGATVVAAYSPRVRPDVPVSFPVAWDRLEQVHPRDFTVRTAAALLGDGDPWREAMPAPQTLPADVLAEGHEIPIARVAMHEGKRRKRAQGSSSCPGGCRGTGSGRVGRTPSLVLRSAPCRSHAPRAPPDPS